LGPSLIFGDRLDWIDWQQNNLSQQHKGNHFIIFTTVKETVVSDYISDQQIEGRLTGTQSYIHESRMKGALLSGLREIDRTGHPVILEDY
jgi:hypothetical protein